MKEEVYMYGVFRFNVPTFYASVSIEYPERLHHLIRIIIAYRKHLKSHCAIKIVSSCRESRGGTR